LAQSAAKVQFLNGQFVAYGPAPGLVTSKDGTNWSALSLPFDVQVGQLAYGNGNYVLAGGTPSGGTLIATSPDLSNWTLSNTGMTTPIGSVAFGDGVYVAVGPGAAFQVGTPVILTSTNGLDWSQTSTTNATEVAYGNGMFVAPTYTEKVLVSPDGTSWNPITITNTGHFVSISFANGRFYAGGFFFQSILTLPLLYTSTDGLTWTPASDPRPQGPLTFHALYGNGILLAEAPSFTGPFAVSTNGSNFVAITANNIDGIVTLSGTAYGNGVFVDEILQTSVDATNWSNTAISPTNSSYFLNDLIYGTNGYVAVPTAQPLLQSPNGIKFSFLTNTIPVSEPRIKTAAGIYIAVGDAGALAISTNELDWFSRNSASSSTLNDVEYGNSTWVAVGAGGTITTSSTGNAWSLRTSGTSVALNGIAYGTNLFVVVGNSGTVLTSPDGISWSPQFAGTLLNLNKIVYGNGQFVAVGAQGAVLTSLDGTNWISRVSGTQESLGAIAVGEGTFCAVSAGNQTNLVVITSNDGVTWQPHQTDALRQLTMTGTSGVRYFNGTFLVFADNRILQSGPITAPKLQLSLNGSIPNLTIQSATNLLLQVQSAQNLIGPWQVIGLFTNSAGSILIPDNSASGQPQQFYRTSVP